jgi:hypothetical protein
LARKRRGHFFPSVWHSDFGTTGEHLGRVVDTRGGRGLGDLGWAGTFLISGGFFSHWQVWIALSITLKMLSSTLLAWGSRTGKLSEEN